MIAVEGARNHGLLNIATSDFFETRHNLPSLQEQNRIATFLNLYYKKIELQRKKVELLEKRKCKILNLLLFKTDNLIPFIEVYKNAGEGEHPRHQMMIIIKKE